MADALHGLAIPCCRSDLLCNIGMANLASVVKMIGTISFLTNRSVRCLNCCELAGLRESSQRADLVARERISEYCKQLEQSKSYQYKLCSPFIHSQLILGSKQINLSSPLTYLAYMSSVEQDWKRCINCNDMNCYTNLSTK